MTSTTNMLRKLGQDVAARLVRDQVPEEKKARFDRLSKWTKKDITLLAVIRADINEGI